MIFAVTNNTCSGAEGCYPPVVDMLQMDAMMPAYFPNGRFEFHPELRRSSFRQRFLPLVSEVLSFLSYTHFGIWLCSYGGSI